MFAPDLSVTPVLAAQIDPVVSGENPDGSGSAAGKAIQHRRRGR